MTQHKATLPKGMQDTLPEVCAYKQALSGRLSALFERHGFARLETPLLETYDLFSRGPATLPQQHLWKTTAPDGRILVIRPDNTTPAVRLACTRYPDAPLPLRFCYVQSVLSYPGTQHDAAHLLESTQAGVELLGESGPEGDAEIIALAIRALKEAGLEDFQIDVGQVEFFKGLMEEAGLSDEQAEQLRGYVEEKNMLAIELMLREQRLGERVSARILQLPALYGGSEVLDEAERMTRHPRCMAAVRTLRDVLALLRDDGLDGYLSIDLGMVHAINYYSGLIFRGITGHLGQPLLSGGRYDALPADMGRPMGATGFGLVLELLLHALQRQGVSFPAPCPDILMGYAPGCRRQALEAAEALRAEGQRVALCYLQTAQGVAAMRADHRVEKALFVTSEGVREVTSP